MLQAIGGVLYKQEWSSVSLLATKGGKIYGCPLQEMFRIIKMRLLKHTIFKY